MPSSANVNTGPIRILSWRLGISNGRPVKFSDVLLGEDAPDTRLARDAKGPSLPNTDDEIPLLGKNNKSSQFEVASYGLSGREMMGRRREFG